MKCPNCGAEVREEDKFCGECGKPLRRQIEIAPKWKWGSMIASLVLVFIFWFVCMAIVVDSIPYSLEDYEQYEQYIDQYLITSVTLLIFGFSVTGYLMYKERTAKIKYGLGWILFPILILCLDLAVGYESALWVCTTFLWLAIPAIVIDVIYVYKTR